MKSKAISTSLSFLSYARIDLGMSAPFFLNPHLKTRWIPKLQRLLCAIWLFLIVVAEVFFSVNSYGGTIAVASLKGHSVTLIDENSLAEKTLTIGDGKTSFPGEPAFYEDQLYVTLHNYDFKTHGHFLYRIDLNTHRHQHLLPFEGTSHMATEISAYDGKLYVTDERGHNTRSELFVIDINLLNQHPMKKLRIHPAVQRIPVGKTPAGLSIDKNHRKAYIANRYSSYVSVVDLLQNSEVERVKVVEQGGENNLYDVSSIADGFIVTVLKDHQVKLYDDRKKTLSIIQGNFSYPAGSVVSLGNDRAYIANFQKNFISVIDLKMKKEIATIRVGNHPVELIIAFQSNRLFVSNWSDRSVTVVDLKTKQILKSILVGEIPLGLAYTEKNYVDGVK